MSQKRGLSLSNAGRNAASVSDLQPSLMAQGDAELATRSEGPATSPTGTVMARGSLVSFFRGGLAAVRINEENFDDEDEGAPTILSPEEIPDVKKKASSDAGAYSLFNINAVTTT